MSTTLMIRQLGQQPYEPVWRAMQTFTEQRTADTADELWLLTHPPVYTLGRAGKQQHLLQANEIPLLRIDRGGQITYHGPGQLIVYLLLDLKRLGLGIRPLVQQIEQAIIDMLAQHHIEAESRREAPGVYVGERKIAALGLRVRRGCCYHGLSLNCDMDLSPFAAINPCGYPGLQLTQLRDLGVPSAAPGNMALITPELLTHLTSQLHYDIISYSDSTPALLTTHE